MTDAEADAALERAVSDVYEYVMTDALADDRFTATERARLESIAQGLALPDALRDQLYAKAAKQSIQRMFSAAISDRRYSGQEEQALQELAASLNVKMTHDADTTALIARLRLLGRIVDGHLPEELVAITLKRGETCHFMAEGVTHKEFRTVTKRVSYGGPTASIKIMKGVRWRMGSVALERVSEDILTPLDTVTFYLTSSRVFLQGERKNTTVALSKIAHFTLYKDGLQIEKDTGGRDPPEEWRPGAASSRERALAPSKKECPARSSASDSRPVAPFTLLGHPASARSPRPADSNSEGHSPPVYHPPRDVFFRVEGRWPSLLAQ